MTIITYRYIVSPPTVTICRILICLPESKQKFVKKITMKIKSAVSSYIKKRSAQTASSLYTFCRFYQRQNFNKQRIISVPYRCCLPFRTTMLSPMARGILRCSLNGINYLCNDGYSYRDFCNGAPLPNFKIRFFS